MISSTVLFFDGQVMGVVDDDTHHWSWASAWGKWVFSPSNLEQSNKHF